MGGSGDVHAVFMSGIIRDNNSPWFDDTRTAEKETRDAVIGKSFSEAVTELSGKLGGDPAKWKWGDLHQTLFDHVLSRIPGLGAVFSRGPAPTPGSRYTVDVSAFDYNKPYGVTAIPSYRQIIDWSNLGGSLSMHTTGQSGLAFSKHYDDMISSWINVRYHTMLFNRQDVEADRQALLVLTPQGG
jgi:penicillin amidase